MSISAPARSFGARPYNNRPARIFNLPRSPQRNIRRLYGAKTGLVELAWSDWRPLAGAGRDRRLPKSPGLYRIRRIETQQLLYLGQTGRSLRQRLGSLSGVYGAEMPTTTLIPLAQRYGRCDKTISATLRCRWPNSRATLARVLNTSAWKSPCVAFATVTPLHSTLDECRQAG